MDGLAFGLVIFFGLFEYGFTIMCYECNSAINPLCSEKHLPDNMKRNCSDLDRGVAHTLCRKIIQHVDYGMVNGQLPTSRVVRSCGWDETKYKVRHHQPPEKHLPNNLKRNTLNLESGVAHTLCRRIIQHMNYGMVNGQLPISRVVQSCGWDETKYKGACYHRSGFGGRQEVCSCTKDLCNDGHTTISSVAILLTTTFVFVLK